MADPIVVKVMKPKVHTNVQWLVYSPGKFNKLVHAATIPPEIQAIISKAGNAAFFYCDVTVTPFAFGAETTEPEDWPKPTPPAFTPKTSAKINGVQVGQKMPTRAEEQKTTPDKSVVGDAAS